MAYGGRKDDPQPPIGSMIDRSRIQLPGRVEPRRAASGTDVKTFSVIYTLDGGGAVFIPDTIGCDFHIRIPCTISAIAFWTADGAAASINFDLWQGTFGAAMTIANTILPAAIAVVGASSYEDKILANVTKQLTIDKVLKLYVNTSATFKRAFVEVKLERAI